MNVFLPLRGRLKAIKVVFAVIVAVALAATFADLYELVLLQRAIGGAGWLGWIVMYYTLPLVLPGGARADALTWALANLADAVGATLAILAATALTKQVEAGWAMRTPPAERTPAALQLEGARG